MVKTRSSSRIGGSSSGGSASASRNEQDQSELRTRLRVENGSSRSQRYNNSTSSRPGQPQQMSGSGSSNVGQGSGTTQSGGQGKDPLAPTSRGAPLYPQQHYGQDSRVVMPVAPRQSSLYNAAAAASVYGYGGASLVPSSAGPLPTYPVHPDVRFKKLPFYDIMAEIMKPTSLVPMTSQRMQESSFYFHLTPQQATEIATGKDIVGVGNKLENIVQAQLRFCLLETSCEQDDCFPPNVTVKVNNKICPLPNPIPTNKPGVEPKRPPRPVNITSLVKLSPTVANTISVTWATDFARGYALSVFLVRKLTSSELLQRLKNKGTKNPDYTRSLIKEKLSEDYDSEIATTSLRVSLMCPLGKMKMLCPCRPAACPHLQCFDASLFLQMNERKPTWLCPVCDRPAPYDSLVVDGYFQDVLSSQRLAGDCSEIQLHADGNWSANTTTRAAAAAPPPPVTLISDDIEVIPLESGNSNGSSSSKRAAVGEERKAVQCCVDLTSDSEDDLPLKRKDPIATPTQPVEYKPLSVSVSGDAVSSSGYVSPREAPVISLDSPSPPPSNSPRQTTPTPATDPVAIPPADPSPPPAHTGPAWQQVAAAAAAANNVAHTTSPPPSTGYVEPEQRGEDYRY